MRSNRVRLPGIGTPSELLLTGYVAPLLHSLRKAGVAPGVVLEVERAEKGLRKLLQARELSERLATRADALAEAAELAVEVELRALDAALATRRSLREGLFPAGLGGALSPRGEAQMVEVTRLLEVARRSKVPEAAAAVLVRLGAANAALPARLAAASAAYEAVVNALAAEHREQRKFRDRCRWALGALTGLFPSDAAKVAAFFEKPSRHRSEPKALPAAPPPTPHPAAKRAPRAKQSRR